MTNEADELFKDATKYGSKFTELLLAMDSKTVFSACENEAAIIQTMKMKIQFETHFLFPNVADEIRDTLFKLAYRRFGIGVSRNSSGGAAQYAQMEAEFVDLSKWANEILDDLLPWQAEILKEKYLSNPLVDQE